MSNSSTFSDGNNFDNGGSGQRENNGGSGGGGDNQSAEQQRGGSGGANNDNVCRDFLNNVCFRGSRCKYFHPPDMGMATEPKKEEFRFCNDYQNRGCRRENCRYVHCARADVDDYEQTGRMSEALAKAIVAITGQDQVAGRPLCKEFLSGSCSRGNRCRFWHINPREEKELRAMESASGLGGAGGAPGVYPPPSTRGRPGGRSANVRGGGGGQFPYAPAPASHHAIDPPYWAYDGVHGGVGVPPQEYDRYQSAGMYEPYADFNGPVRRDAKRPRLDERFANPASQQRSRSISPTAYTTVLEENAALRRKVDMLKQTIAEVTASNDTLISENARLRAKTATTAAAVTDQAIVAASMASAAAINSVLSSSVAGLNPQALVPPAGSTLTPAEHLAVVSLAAAGHQQPMVVQPQALETDGVRWSFSQMNR